MPQLTASSAIALQLEDVNDIIPLLVEAAHCLDARIKDNGRSNRVSTKSFRVRIQTALTGAVSKINLDGGSLPSGGSSQWDQFVVTPLAYAVPIQYTRLADLVGEPKDVATINPVSKTIADAAIYIQRMRDIFLQTNGDGKLATVDASYTGGGANPIILAATPFGARLLHLGQKVHVFTSNFATDRGACTITGIVNTLGTTQSITVDVVPAGTVAGDIIVVDGLATGNDPFINGIPVFHSTSTTGTLLGINRSNNYVVANGVNAANASITLPLLRLAQNQIVVALGEDGLKGQIWHTHPSQLQAYEELGFQLQYVPLTDGKAKNFDGLYQKMSIDGREILNNVHADQTRWDLVNIKSWGKVKWGNPPFWFKNRGGQTVFQQYDTTSGNPQSIEKSYLVDAIQFYVDNPKSLSSVTSCKVPAGN
ncbi:MAG TPA: hypothetical protein VKD65_06435 [Candidatus Angelobacter sp.]|nr:hypothetical protein [Candidatus Angelobacter sp.]